MADIPIQLSAQDGQYIGRMKLGVTALLADAEETARDRNLSKRTALSTVLQEHLLDAGFKIGDTELAAATAKLDLARRGEKLIRLELTVCRSLENGEPGDGANRKLVKYAVGKNEPMTNKRETNQVVSFFELEQKYPDAHALAWYERLVGLDEQKKELLIKLEMLLYPQKVEAWSRRHHGKRVL